MNKLFINLLLAFILIHKTTNALDQIAIVIIVDQCAHYAFEKIAPYTQGGIRELLDKGIIYNNAHFPYARTSTGPGHATINTGTLPKNHGIVANYWFNTDGKKIPCDYDASENAAIFSPEGVYKTRKSAANARVDGISEQVMLASTPLEPCKIIAISLKSRAAVFLAGHCRAETIWYDKKSGNFTSSKAYYKNLPTWLTNFNNQKKIFLKNNFTWKLFHQKNNPAYSMVKDNYEFARLPTLINKTVDISFFQKDLHKKHPQFDPFSYMPESNKILLDLAEASLKKTLQENPKKILLWISLSSLDKIGHVFGPDSYEYIDTLYRIDDYLKHFMQTVRTIIPENKILFAFTADHGVTPLVELMQQEDFSQAQRILTGPLEQNMNELIKKNYDIESIIKEIDIPSIFVNTKKITHLKEKEKNQLLNDLKEVLLKHRGIKNVWTYQELENTFSQPNDFTTYYKNQIFPGRTGSLIYQTFPYAYVTNDTKGTGHVSPYDYTTHVPLILYQPGKTQNKTITQRVSMTQLAPTLAQKLSIQRPSACVEDQLPE